MNAGKSSQVTARFNQCQQKIDGDQQVIAIVCCFNWESAVLTVLQVLTEPGTNPLDGIENDIQDTTPVFMQTMRVPTRKKLASCQNLPLTTGMQMEC